MSYYYVTPLRIERSDEAAVLHKNVIFRKLKIKLLKMASENLPSSFLHYYL